MFVRPILFALALGILVPNAVVAEDAFSSPEFESTSTDAPLETVFLGVMGEVARPGVYVAPKGSTLAQLLKRAGGITQTAKETVRVFRGGRFAEQMFLSAGKSPVLFAGDLVVVESRPDIRAPSRSADGNRQTLRATPSSEVQLAFLNVIDRPVVVKMLAGQATVTRIVEFLKQPAQVASTVRVLPPSVANRRVHRSDFGPDNLLSTGTVLVFPRRSVRTTALPALPAPIVESAINAMSAGPVDDWGQTPSCQQVSIRTHATAAATGQFRTAAATDQHETVQALTDTNDSSIPEDASQASNSQNPPEVENSQNDFDQSEHAISEEATSSALAPKSTGSHSRWLVGIVSSLGAFAALAMLLTLASIIGRQHGPAKLWGRWRQLACRMMLRAHAPTGDSSTAVRSIPVPRGVGGVGRPLRIDANQQITRLGIDLSVAEPKERAAA